MKNASNFLTTTDSNDQAKAVGDALTAVRTHLGMPIAYLSEFVDGQAVFRDVSAPGLEHVIKPGDSKAVEDIYCKRILDGELPQLIPDTSLEPIAQALEITHQGPIGSHVSVPIHRDDGSVYGMFCCLSPEPNPTLNERDLNVMTMFAGLVQKVITEQTRGGTQNREVTERIKNVLQDRAFDIHLQPIVALATDTAIGVEALSRFQPLPYRSPDIWFADAASVGQQLELEITCISAAIENLAELGPSVYLSLNASPETISSGVLRDIFNVPDAHRIVLELTEHTTIADQDALLSALSDLRKLGVRIAVDDLGAGYASLSTVLRLKPDIIKLDRSLVAGIDNDAASQALTTAIVHFTQEIGGILVAEGIETPAEHETLRSLGVIYGQGYLMARPNPAAQVCAALRDADKAASTLLHIAS